MQRCKGEGPITVVSLLLVFSLVNAQAPKYKNDSVIITRACALSFAYMHMHYTILPNYSERSFF